MRNPFKRQRPPAPAYRSVLNACEAVILDPQSTDEQRSEAAQALWAMGPIPGSTAAKRDPVTGRCYHIGPYPGCRGGCSNYHLGPM